MKPLPRPFLVQGALLLALIALGALKIALPLYATGLRVFGPNEGWFALTIASWRDGLPLYPGTNEFFVVNYLPLAYLPYRALAAAFGNMILAGRCLSWVLLAAIAAASGLAAFFATRQRWCAAIAGVLVFATFAAWFNDKLGVIEPQLIGHLAQLIALALLVRSPRDRTELLVATVLMIAGGLVKPNLFGFPGGLVLWMWLIRREDFPLFVIFCAILGIIVPVVLYLIFGPNLFFPNVLIGRVYAWSALLENLKVLDAIAVPLAACLLVLPRRPRSEVDALLLCVLAGSALELVVSGAAVAVTNNAGYDIALSACIGAAVACGRLADATIAPTRLRAVDAILAAAALRVLIAIIPQLNGLPASFAAARDEDREARAIIAQLAAVPGGAACSHPMLCYLAGKHTRINLSGGSDFYFRPPRSHDLLRQLLQSGEVDALELYRAYDAVIPEIVPLVANDFRRLDLPELRHHDAMPRADDSLVFVRTAATGAAR
jgi:hypothetical protein